MEDEGNGPAITSIVADSYQARRNESDGLTVGVGSAA
jgi:hypothetical protein